MSTTGKTRKRVLVGGMMHETHTFLEGETGAESFTTVRGAQIFDAIGDVSCLAGVMETARDCGWTVLPSVYIYAMPTATVADAVVENWWAEFEVDLRKSLRDGLDAVYLVLHGAMASVSLPDVEGDILKRIRDVVGPDIPIFGVTDLHGNISPAMAKFSNCLVTYRENPHTDAKATAVLSARLLDRVLERGEHARSYWRHSRVMWPPTGTGTADGAMGPLEALARRIEAEDADILAVNVYAGYSFADTPDTGVCFTIATVGAEAAAQEYLRRLCELAVQNKDAGNVIEPTLEEVLPKVKALLAQPGEGPIVLVEPSDNIGGGAPGDGVRLLAALIEHGIENSAVIVDDAAAVAQLAGLQPGARRTVQLGGKGSPLSGGSLPLELELISTSDGHFNLEDPHSHAAAIGGMAISMGPCALARHAGVTILLTSHKTPPFDLGQWRSQGVEPESLSVIGVKAAVAHRQAYNPIARASFLVGTPGPCTSNLKTLPFRLVDRPIFPLD